MTSPAISVSDLDSLGIEEVEPWICEDSSFNRRLLRGNGLMWETVRGEDGELTGLIRAFSPEALAERRDSVWDRRRPIMVEPNNRYSEYVGPDEYPLDYDVPIWLQRRIRWWQDDDRKGIPEAQRRPFPVRCEVIRFDGTRCWNWAPEPKKINRCKNHQGWTADVELRNAQLARHRLLEAAPDAADALEYLVHNAESEPVRLKAATEILDRVGVRGGMEIDTKVEVEQVDNATVIRKKLQRLAERAVLPALGAPAPVIEAEVVEHDAE